MTTVRASSTRMKPGSSPLGETSMVPSAAIVPTSANGQRFRKAIACSSSESRILARVVGRGSAMMRRKSSVEVRRAMSKLRRADQVRPAVVAAQPWDATFGL
jgi:hypothetical protein